MSSYKIWFLSHVYSIGMLVFKIFSDYVVVLKEVIFFNKKCGATHTLRFSPVSWVHLPTYKSQYIQCTLWHPDPKRQFICRSHKEWLRAGIDLAIYYTQQPVAQSSRQLLKSFYFSLKEFIKYSICLNSKIQVLCSFFKLEPQSFYALSSFFKIIL